MSRVFVAADTTLGRRVVVKVLPAEMAAGISIDRFRREIALAARLQHPHIVPLLSAGDLAQESSHDVPLPYFTMPMVDGESLRVRLTKGGELPIAEGMRLLREVASALDYAHEMGIVHRDIKPDNILLSRGSAMVTDFGVAKALSGSANADAAAMTSMGIALGTPAYMAPEQAAASPNIDARADLYALGVMAYELFAGRPPFAGRSPQATLAAHVSEAPEPIQKLRPSLPPALATLIMRCLEKNPADRPQHASEFVQQLDAITTPSGGSPPTVAIPAKDAPRSRSARNVVLATVAIVLVAVLALTMWWRGRVAATPSVGDASIAVLSFENGGGDTTYAYLAEGLADELRSGLTRLGSLRVKSRSASMRFAGSPVDMRTVGTKLAVGKVLQGTVSRVGGQLHVTVDLVDVSNDNALWSATFDRPATDLGGIQDSIATAVAATLRVKTAARPTIDAISERGTTDAFAYESFLKGRHATDPDKTIRFYQNAVARDPRFARAYGALAAAYATQTLPGLLSRDSALALANESLRKAEAIDSTLVEVLGAKAAIDFLNLQYTKAVVDGAKVVASDSTNPAVHLGYGTVLGALGRIDEALAEVRRARALDPLSEGALIDEQYYLLCLRRFRDAVDLTKQITELDTAAAPAYENEGEAYVFLGKPDSALTAFKQAFAVAKGAYGARGSLIFGYAAAGRWADVERERQLAKHDPPGNSPYLAKAFDEALSGRIDVAMTALEKSVANREPSLGSMSLSCDPLVDPLKASPRFAPLMQRLGIRICPALGTWPVPRAPAR
jgi:serine/threonine-protein kinase